MLVELVILHNSPVWLTTCIIVKEHTPQECRILHDCKVNVSQELPTVFYRLIATGYNKFHVRRIGAAINQDFNIKIVHKDIFMAFNLELCNNYQSAVTI